ncbi:unnamed protein product, partial [Effrenium voratum]
RFRRPPRTAEDNFRSACAGGNVAMVRKLLAGDMDVNCQTSHGYTGLHAAAAHGHTAIAEALLEAEAYADASASRGVTPLMLAAMAGHHGTAKVLLQHRASVNEELRPVRGDTVRTALDLARSFEKTK